MGYVFVITKETTIKKGDLPEVRELLKAKKMKFIITNPKYKDSEARIMFERGMVDLRKSGLKAIPRETFNNIETNGRYLDLRRQSLGTTGKKR